MTFKPKVQRCEKCGTLFTTEIKDCPMCTKYYALNGRKRVVHANALEDIKKKYGIKL